MDGMTVFPHERLTVARKRRDLTQREAADLVDCGMHAYIAIELGRLVPAQTENGLQIAANIEREFGIPVSAWSAKEAA